jgi:hypothetical protein
VSGGSAPRPAPSEPRRGESAPLVVLDLEGRARRAASPEALAFVIANDTFRLAAYRQAVVFVPAARRRLRLLAVSGLATLEEDAPYTVWLTQVLRALWPLDEGAPRRLRAADLSPELRADWQAWLPAEVVVSALRDRVGEPLAGVLYATDPPWSDEMLARVALLHESYGYCWAALSAPGRGWLRRAAERLPRWALWLSALALVSLVMALPVRLSALAPAEIVARDAIAVSAPADGVLRTFHVPPSAAVKRGDLLFSLDDTIVRNRLAVARKGLAVVRTEALTAQQRAFDSLQSRGELPALAGRVQERAAEVAFLEEQLGRIDVRAPRDGVAIYGDPNDWIGRPVQTGERVLLVANPGDAGVLVWLPVADAVTLEPGTRIRMFLDVAPLEPLSAWLEQTSYQAVLSPDGVASYRVRARLEGTQALARVGLKGTAKLFGERVPLAYYLFRRPLAALRQWSGW